MDDMTPLPVTWTIARVDALKALWAAGWSGSRIARELGGLTHSAVIGKVHRLGLSGRDRTEMRSASAEAVHAVANINREKARAAKPKHNRTPPELLAERAQAVDNRQAQFASEAEGGSADAFDRAIPRRQRKTIWQLTEKTCRYPVGQPGEKSFFFCGGPADNAAGQVYCRKHMPVCFRGVPSKPRLEFSGRD